MMNNIKILIGLFLSTFLLIGCVKDGVDECPTGDIRLHFFVEKFQNKSANPLDDYEKSFGLRVNHFRYYLYKDGKLFEQGIKESLSTITREYYDIQYSDLEYGDYEMVVVSNSTKNALTGDGAFSSELLLTYPGCDHTEDYFTTVYKFTVNTDQSVEHKVGMLRTQGVIRYTFNNVPDEITHMEIIMENVGLEKWVTGDYVNACHASRVYEMIPLRQQSEERYVLTTFPTPKDEFTSFRLNLYRNGETEPYRKELISNDLTVIRNQLLDLVVTFDKNANINFEIILDSEWDGSSPGGETEIN